MVTLNVHGLPGATCAPLRLILCVALVTVSVPLQTVVLESVTVNVESNVSVKATPVKVVAAFGLVIVKLTWVVSPSFILFGLNDLLIVGGWTTVRVALWLVAGVSPQALVPSTL